MIENNIISDHFTVEELKKLKITPPDAKMYKKIRSNWDSVAKPLVSKIILTQDISRDLL